MQPMCGSSAPAPMTSHALSAAAAINGSPLGIPVAAAASPLIALMLCAGGTRSARISGFMGTARHFQSQCDAQRSFL